MIFDAPYMLWFLLLLLPLLLLHFYPARRHKQSFPAIALLQRVYARHRMRRQLHNWALLLLRIGIVATLVLAAARPRMEVWRPGGVRSGAPLALVVVLDNSLSMSLAADGESNFSKARDLVRSELERLRAGDEVNVVLAGKPVRVLFDSFKNSTGVVNQALEALPAGYGGDAAEAALTRAAELLQMAPQSQKEIFYITDNGWSKKLAPFADNAGYRFRKVLLGTNGRDSNLAVMAANAQYGDSNNPKEAVITANVRNFSTTEARNTTLELVMNERVVASALVHIPPGAVQTKRFSHRFDNEGVHWGALRITDDVLKEDNTAYFAVNIKRAINVLVLSGDYQPGAYHDEAFFLLKALATPQETALPIVLRHLAASDMSGVRFDGYDSIFVVGVSRWPKKMCTKLAAFVEKGGGVFVAPGDAPWDNMCDADFFSATVTGVRSWDGAQQAILPDTDHPIFSAFVEQQSGLETVGLTKALRVAPDPNSGRQVVMQLSDGTPLMLEKKLGEGTVLLFLSTVDRAWTDLPIRPGFLPLVQSSARYMSHAIGSGQTKYLAAGQEHRIALPPNSPSVTLVLPDQTRMAEELNSAPDSDQLIFKHTGMPGIHRVLAASAKVEGLRELPDAMFVVQPDTRDLMRVGHGDAMMTPDISTRYNDQKGHVPGWQIFLLVAFLLVFIDGIVAVLQNR